MFISLMFKISLMRLRYFLESSITEFCDTVSMIIIIKIYSNGCYG